MGGERMRHSIRPWRWVVAPLTCAFVQALLAAPASAQAPTLQPNPQIQVEYIEPKAAAAADKAEYERTYAWLRERRPLEEIRKFLAPLRLPRPINMQVDTCGAEHRDYLFGGPVTVCYETDRQNPEGGGRHQGQRSSQADGDCRHLYPGCAA